jgi:hypothetical protein
MTWQLTEAGGTSENTRWYHYRYNTARTSFRLGFDSKFPLMVVSEKFLKMKLEPELDKSS